MNELPTLLLACLAGAILGAIFFGGLWWTVRMGLASQRPALWFFGSILLRMSIALTGFYFVGVHDFARLLLCLLGFIAARLVVTVLSRRLEEKQASPVLEASHAPDTR